MNGFNAPIYVPLRYARTRQRIAVAAHLITLALLVASSATAPSIGLAAVAVTLHYIHECYVARKRPVQPVRALWLTPAQRWQLADANGVVQAVQLRSILAVTPAYIALSVVSSTNRVTRLIIFADEAPPQAFRRLRVHLLLGRLLKPVDDAA